MGITCDANFLIDIVRGSKAALAKDEDVERRGLTRVVTTPVIYEVLLGVTYTRSRSQMAALRSLLSRYVVVPFDEPSAARAAEIQAELMRLGRPKAHPDVMIAGIAAQAGHVLVTRDRDFDAVADVVGLDVEHY